MIQLYNTLFPNTELGFDPNELLLTLGPFSTPLGSTKFSYATEGFPPACEELV